MTELFFKPRPRIKRTYKTPYEHNSALTYHKTVEDGNIVLAHSPQKPVVSYDNNMLKVWLCNATVNQLNKYSSEQWLGFQVEQRTGYKIFTYRGTKLITQANVLLINRNNGSIRELS